MGRVYGTGSNDLAYNEEELRGLDVALSDVFRVWLAVTIGLLAATAVLGWATADLAATWTAGAAAVTFGLLLLTMAHASLLDRLLSAADNGRAHLWLTRLARPHLLEIPSVCLLVIALQLTTRFLDIGA